MEKRLGDMENLRKKLPTKYIGDVKPYRARNYHGFLDFSQNGKNYPLSMYLRKYLRKYLRMQQLSLLCIFFLLFLRLKGLFFLGEKLHPLFSGIVGLYIP